MFPRILLAFALLMVTAPALAADSKPGASSTVNAGGLSCFTVTPTKYALKDAIGSESCDELCASQGAACTGVAVGAMNPPPNCATHSITPEFVSCRCCNVTK